MNVVSRIINTLLEIGGILNVLVEANGC